MITWLKSFLPQAPATEEELRDLRDSDPELFSEDQREYLKGLFPKAKTHLDNFSQEELLKFAVALAAFGYPIQDERDFIYAFDTMVLQEIIVVDSYNPYIISRA